MRIDAALPVRIEENRDSVDRDAICSETAGDVGLLIANPTSASFA
jgi:hypothetical protein